MRAYIVHKFQVCQITQSTLIETSAATKSENLNVTKKEFLNPNLALGYIRENAKVWFMTALNDFVIHKENIHIEGISPKYQTAKLCKAILLDFTYLNIFEIVIRFKKNIHLFKEIIPGPKNPSCESSFKNIEQLEFFCDNFINLKLNIN